MGTDDLFRKRRARKANELARRKAGRKPYAKVLLVCEGEKTEPRYFNGLRDYFRLTSANVEVCGECGSDPLSIYHYARQRYREEKVAGDPFDRVYCVFDRDTHSTYQQALDQISRSTPKNTFLAANSVPCFEYWLLLHFNYTTKPYNHLPGSSACNQVLTELKSYIPHYTKGSNNILSETIDKLDNAKSNAIRALRTAQANATDNPTTHVHELVGYLQNIKGT